MCSASCSVDVKESEMFLYLKVVNRSLTLTDVVPESTKHSCSNLIGIF